MLAQCSGVRRNQAHVLQLQIAQVVRVPQMQCGQIKVARGKIILTETVHEYKTHPARLSCCALDWNPKQKRGVVAIVASDDEMILIYFNRTQGVLATKRRSFHTTILQQDHKVTDMVVSLSGGYVCLAQHEPCGTLFLDLHSFE
jgi:hypothetical protein